jgi:hypothetical protein
MRTLMLTMALLVMACGEETGPGVGGQEAELHCRAWCDSGGCYTGSNSPENCRENCRNELAEPCGGFIKAEHDCMTAMSCRDPFEDCAHHDDDHRKCLSDLRSLCGNCPEGSDYQACFMSGGDCDATRAEADCRHLVDAGRCTDFAGCVENEGRCPPDA